LSRKPNTTYQKKVYVWREEPQYYKYDFTGLARTAGLDDFDKEAKDILFFTAKQFFVDYATLSELKSHNAETERFLQVFRKEALAFLKLIDELDPLADYFATSFDFRDKPYLKIMRRLKADIRALRRTSQEIINQNSLKSKGRPSNRQAMYTAVPELALVFECLTNQKASVTWVDLDEVYRSTFYDFVHSFIRMLFVARGKYFNRSDQEIEMDINECIGNNASFGKAIQRALTNNHLE